MCMAKEEDEDVYVFDDHSEFSEDGVIFREATKKNIPQIASLIGSIWGTSKTEEYFLWLVFESVPPATIMCGFSKDKLIGMFILHKLTLSNGLNCGYASGFVIDNNWRGRGHFATLGNLAIDCFPEIDAVFSIPNVSGRFALEKSLGFKTLGRIATLTLPLTEKISCQGTKCEVITGKTNFKSFVANSGNILRFDHSESYRSWRYVFHKMRSFSKVFLSSGEYAVVSLYADSKKKILYGDIADIECALGDGEKLRKLILGACWHLKEQGTEAFTIWTVPNSVIHKIASEIGFIQDHQSRFFCAKVLKPAYEDIYNYSKWDLVQSDAIR